MDDTFSNAHALTDAPSPSVDYDQYIGHSPETNYEDFIGDVPASPMTLNALAEVPSWVAWCDKNGKKIPYSPSGRCAKSNDPATWGTRAQAELAARRLLTAKQKGGIGIQLGRTVGTDHQRIGGVDLDSCLSGDAMAPWAVEIVKRFDSYTEVSPSGSGVKIFFVYIAEDEPALITAMSLPETNKKRSRLSWSRGKHCEIGLDISNRYYAVTERHWSGSPSELRPVPLTVLFWLINVAGPAFKDDAGTSSAASKRDESGSGHGFRFLRDQVREGREKDEAISTLLTDGGKAGDWARTSDKRQLDRAWKHAQELLQAKSDTVMERFEEEDVEEFEKSVTTSEQTDPIVQELNRKHAVVNVNGKTLIATEKRDGIEFGTPSDLHALYENLQVSKGDNKKEAASRRWMRSPERRTYCNGLIFMPSGDVPKDTFNLWRGWAVEPDPDASCHLILAHIRDVVCCGNAIHAAYVIGWIADLVQHANEKPGVAIILKGGKGVGKDTLGEYLAHMIGRHHAPTVSQSAHITGRFNSRLSVALLLHVQEGIWAGDKEAESVLKYLITSKTVEIERKGIDSTSEPSFVRILMTANADWVVPASEDERRFAVFEVSDKHRGDRGYFDALYAEMKSDGPAAFLYFLQKYDLSNFNVRNVPATEGLRDQKLATLKNVHAWWYNRLTVGEPLVEYSARNCHSEIQVSREALRNDYIEWLQSRRHDGNPLDEARFGKAMREMVPSLTGGRPRENGIRFWQYTFPPLAVCRTEFEAWLGSPVAWED